jgi:hypothetical protein
VPLIRIVTVEVATVHPYRPFRCELLARRINYHEFGADSDAAAGAESDSHNDDDDGAAAPVRR